MATMTMIKLNELNNSILAKSSALNWSGVEVPLSSQLLTFWIHEPQDVTTLYLFIYIAISCQFLAEYINYIANLGVLIFQP